MRPIRLSENDPSSDPRSIRGNLIAHYEKYISGDTRVAAVKSSVWFPIWTLIDRQVHITIKRWVRDDLERRTL